MDRAPKPPAATGNSWGRTRPRSPPPDNYMRGIGVQLASRKWASSRSVWAVCRPSGTLANVSATVRHSPHSFGHLTPLPWP